MAFILCDEYVCPRAGQMAERKCFYSSLSLLFLLASSSMYP